MFSANENLALRQHKRRIIGMVEDCLPADVLDLGTTVMVMQVSCKAPGCVPLETAIMILFPPSSTSEKEDVAVPLIEGVEASRHGGTLKTKVLAPMADVTKEDVLDALPPPLGNRSMEMMCLRARDVMLSQITQLMGDDDNDNDSSSVEGRELMACYLQTCLEEYKKRGCVAPEYGKPFAEMIPNEATTEAAKNSSTDTNDTTSMITIEKETANGDKKQGGGGNFVFRHDPQDDNMTIIGTAEADTITHENKSKKKKDAFVITTNSESNKFSGAKNESSPTATSTTTTTTTTFSTASGSPTTTATTGKRSSSSSSTSMDWRRQQNVEKELTSQSILSRLAEREHAPGVRMAGCPCCDPDNVSNYVDSMMML